MAHAEETGAELWFGVVGAPPEAGSGLRFQLAHAAHLRAQMGGFQVDRDSVGAQDLLQRIDDLPANALLERESAGEEAHKAGELGDPDYPVMGDVTHIGMPEEGQ